MSWLEESIADPATRLPPPPPEECCNACNKTLTRLVTFPWDVTRDIRKPNVGTVSGAFYKRLVNWCDKTVCSMYPMLKPEGDETQHLYVVSPTNLQLLMESAELSLSRWRSFGGWLRPWRSCDRLPADPIVRITRNAEISRLQ
jgi:hypothetical protein